MPETTPHYIEFRQVSKAFNSQPVLEQVSFAVDPGETVVILGRSGVGKSVTLSHIMGFLKPDSGQVYVAHQDITEATERELLDARVDLVGAQRDEVVAVFQLREAIGRLTARELYLPVDFYDPDVHYREIQGRGLDGGNGENDAGK